MKTPEMIIFDCGHTLLYQPGFSATRGNRAIYGYIKRNPRNISFEEFDRTVNGLFASIKAERGPILEIHELAFLKLAYEYMEIELSVPMEQAEIIIMNGISPGAVMPHADKMLDYLDSRGIRTGVISNMCFSGRALKSQFDRLLPNHRFEFILASSDHIFKKPHSIMFEIALQKARLPAESVWYCGDSVEDDICGAKSANIFPVLYSGESGEENDPFAHRDEGVTIDFDHLHIRDWREMINILEKP